MYPQKNISIIPQFSLAALDGYRSVVMAEGSSTCFVSLTPLSNSDHLTERNGCFFALPEVDWRWTIVMTFKCLACAPTACLAAPPALTRPLAPISRTRRVCLALYAATLRWHHRLTRRSFASIPVSNLQPYQCLVPHPPSASTESAVLAATPTRLWLHHSLALPCALHAPGSYC
jgi:hypothetical protein